MKEIERKWRLERLPDLRIVNTAVLEQHYISVYHGPTENPEVRLRRTSYDGHTIYSLTTKRGSGLMREEKEIDLTFQQYQHLKGSGLPSVKKCRYWTTVNNYEVEVDEYFNEFDETLGFTAEIEFESLENAKAFEAPEWFGREVTGNDRYRNSSIAVDGFPQ